MRPVLFAAATVLTYALCFSSSDAHTRAAEFAMEACGSDLNLAACDDMIAKTDDTDKEFKAQAYHLRALTRLSLNDLAGAASDIAKLKQIAPDDKGLPGLAEMLSDKSGPEQDLKIDCLSDYVPSPNRIDACTSLIDAKTGAPRQIRDYYAARARAHLRAGDFSGAQADIQRPLQEDPRNIVYVTDSIVFTYAAGDYDTARQMADKAAKTTSDPAQYAFIKAEMAYLLGYHSMAIQEFMAARRLERDRPEGAYWTTILRLDDHEDAMTVLEILIDQLSPQSHWTKTAQFLLGRISVDAFLASAQARPEPVRAKRLCEAYFNIGHQALISGDKVAAAKAFAAVLQTNQYELLHYQAAKMLMKKASQ